MKTHTMDIFRDLKKTFQLSGIDLTKVYIAGGSLINLKDAPNDVDLYCEDDDTIKKVESALIIISTAGKNITDMASTFNVEEYACPVQVIKILKGKPEEVIKQFDFEQNANYLRFSDINVYRKNTSDKLKICENVKTPNTMLFRLVKMLGKGFRIQKKELDSLLDLVQDHYETTPDEWNLSGKELGCFYGTPK